MEIRRREWGKNGESTERKGALREKERVREESERERVGMSKRECRIKEV